VQLEVMNVTTNENTVQPRQCERELDLPSTACQNYNILRRTNCGTCFDFFSIENYSLNMKQKFINSVYMWLHIESLRKIYGNVCSLYYQLQMNAAG